MTVAVWKCELQFCAGPQTHTFYVCEAHKPELSKRDAFSVFFPIERPIEPVDPEAEIDCDACREG